MGTKTTQSKAPEEILARECLAVRVRLLNRTVTNIYDEAFRPLGVTAGQINILAVVARSGPTSPGEVAKRLNMEKSTVSRNLDRLRDHGWLTVSRGDTRRQHKLEISRKGRRLLERTMPVWEKAQEKARKALGPRGVQAIRQAVDALRTPRAGV